MPYYIVICGLSPLSYFPHYLKNLIVFGKKKYFGPKILVDFIHFFVRTLLILRKIQRDIIINVLRSSCKVPVITKRF